MATAHFSLPHLGPQARLLLDRIVASGEQGVFRGEVWEWVLERLLRLEYAAENPLDTSIIVSTPAGVRRWQMELMADERREAERLRKQMIRQRLDERFAAMHLGAPPPAAPPAPRQAADLVPLPRSRQLRAESRLPAVTPPAPPPLPVAREPLPPEFEVRDLAVPEGESLQERALPMEIAEFRDVEEVEDPLAAQSPETQAGKKRKWFFGMAAAVVGAGAASAVSYGMRDRLQVWGLLDADTPATIRTASTEPASPAGGGGTEGAGAVTAPTRHMEAATAEPAATPPMQVAAIQAAGSPPTPAAAPEPRTPGHRTDAGDDADVHPVAAPVASHDTVQLVERAGPAIPAAEPASTPGPASADRQASDAASGSPRPAASHPALAAAVAAGAPGSETRAEPPQPANAAPTKVAVATTSTLPPVALQAGGLPRPVDKASGHAPSPVPAEAEAPSPGPATAIAAVTTADQPGTAASNADGPAKPEKPGNSPGAAASSAASPPSAPHEGQPNQVALAATSGVPGLNATTSTADQHPALTTQDVAAPAAPVHAAAASQAVLASTDVSGTVHPAQAAEHDDESQQIKEAIAIEPIAAPAADLTPRPDAAPAGDRSTPPERSAASGVAARRVTEAHVTRVRAETAALPEKEHGATPQSDHALVERLNSQSLAAALRGQVWRPGKPPAG